VSVLADREHALAIWQAAVAAAEPARLVAAALADPILHEQLCLAKRIIVVGAGKAGAPMCEAVESALADRLDLVESIVNVPAESVRPLQRIRLHAARPAGTNQPTAQGVQGTREILRLVRSADPEDVVFCLFSGGGSALLPSPVHGISLEDKQQLTQLLHACGATINEMNCVRKHLSDVKGGRLAQGFAGRALISLMISDVIGDPLDVIASGPTSPDPTTFADAIAVLDKFQLGPRMPAGVLRHLEAGARGEIEETPKSLPHDVQNRIIGNNAKSLKAAQSKAESLDYRVLNLGSFIEGETRCVATAFAGIIRSIRADAVPLAVPTCILSGGETTVKLAANHGLGGRNQEFVLAALAHLGRDHMRGVTLLSGGTDGEDGPTDAAGALADECTYQRADQMGVSPAKFLDRNDAYHFFERTGDLLKTGLTQTNVMDVRVMLVK
jgi:hydroxypyruvate reductase/glycerate 2-kinase